MRLCGPLNAADAVLVTTSVPQKRAELGRIGRLAAPARDLPARGVDDHDGRRHENSPVRRLGQSIQSFDVVHGEVDNAVARTSRSRTAGAVLLDEELDFHGNRPSAQLLEFGGETVQIVELLVDRRETYVGDLVQVQQPAQHHVTKNLRGHLILHAVVEVGLDIVDEAL